MTRPRKTPTELRSFRWFGKDDLRSSTHRSRARQQGFTADDMRFDELSSGVRLEPDLRLRPSICRVAERAQ